MYSSKSFIRHTVQYSKYFLMKKVVCIIGLIVLFGNNPKAQTIIPEFINLTELDHYQRTHPELFKICTSCPKKEIDGGWKNILNDLPLPADAHLKTESNNLKPSNPSLPLTASPFPAISFLGYVDPIINIPPDTHGAVGPNHVVTATNDYLLVQSKSGTQISRISTTAFAGIPTTCDPYLEYDPQSNRFFYSAIECNGANGNKMAVLVSKTSDPSAGWFRYIFVPDTSYFLDHPYLGFDNRWVIISGRKFPQPDAKFTGPVLFILDKASLISNAPITFGVNAQRLEKTAADGDAPLPVTLYGTNPRPNTFYILQSWNGSNAAIRLSTVTGNIPSASWNTSFPDAVFPTGGSGWTYAPGNIAEQLEETRKLATNDSRISSAVMINGNIWCTHHIGISATNVAVQWWQLNGNPGASFGNVMQRGRIGEGIANNYRWFPSIAVNENEEVLIGYSVSSNTSRVSAAYSFRSKATALNTTDEEYIYKIGLSTYYKDFGGTRARWGDYSHSALDPADGSLWTIQEYADQRLSSKDEESRYGVWWAKISPGANNFQTDAAIGAIVEPVAGPICKFPISAKVTIRNLGKDTLKNVQVGVILDNISLGSLNTLTNLSIATFTNTAVISISPDFTTTPGNHTLKIFTVNPNGKTDLRPENDTTTTSFNVVASQSLPYSESFETNPFPTANGSAVLNPDNRITWAGNLTTGKPGNNSIWLNCYDYNLIGQKDIYRTPQINTDILDSLNISFNVAYRQFPGSSDSLAVMVSTDCGNTWLPTWYIKGGAQLSTVNGTDTNSFVPQNPGQWRTETLTLKDFCASNWKNILIGFQSYNDFGNNIYLDGINMTGYASSQRNISLNAINLPKPALCVKDYITEISLSNAGLDAITSLKLNYQLDGGEIKTILWNGSLNKCSNLTIPLPTATTEVGTHIIKIFTSEPNRLTDQYTGNDTLSKTFSVFSTVPTATPLFEGFEDPNFPRPNWGIQNVNGGNTFERSLAAAKTGNGSLVIKNSSAVNSFGAVDYFITPLVQNSATFDSVFVNFDLAYQLGVPFPGSSILPLDTLEIMATKDCGATFITVYKKWGNELQTLNNPDNTVTAPFIPAKQSDWKNKKIYLNPIVGTDNFQLYFAVKGNKQNNLWLDNINITSQILPKRLKQQGYLIYPNPFNNSFLIHHSAVEPPVNLQSVQVFNTAGQIVWDKRYNGNASRQIIVELNNQARGVYILKLIYKNKTVVERIVKG